MILDTLKKTLHLVLIFSMIGLPTHSAWGMQGAGGDEEAAKSRAQQAPSMAELLRAARTARPIATENTRLVSLSPEQQLQTLQKKRHFDGDQAYRYAIKELESAISSLRDTVDEQVFCNAIDEALLYDLGTRAQANKTGCCLNCPAPVRRVLKGLGWVAFLVPYIASVVPIVSTTTYAIGDLFFSRDAKLGGFFLGLWYLDLLPTVISTGKERLEEIIKSCSGVGSLKTKGEMRASIPNVYSPSFKEKLMKAAVFIASVVYALGPVAVYSLEAQNLSKPSSQRDKGNLPAAIIGSPFFALILTEVNYKMGLQAVDRALQARDYAGAHTEELKRKVMLSGVRLYRQKVLVEGTDDDVRKNYKLFIAASKDGSMNAFGCLMLLLVDTTIESLYEEEAGQGNEEAEGRDAEKEDLKRKIAELEAGILEKDMLDRAGNFASRKPSWWGAIKDKMTDFTMGIASMFGFQTLQFLTHKMLLTMGVEESRALAVSYTFSSLATGAITLISWEEVRELLGSMRQIASFHKKTNWKFRLFPRVHALVNAAVFALIEIIEGLYIFGRSPTVYQAIPIGAGYLSRVAVYYLFFNSANQKIVTDILTRNPSKKHKTALNKQRAVLEYYSYGLEDILKHLTPRSIDKLFGILVLRRKTQTPLQPQGTAAASGADGGGGVGGEL